MDIASTRAGGIAEAYRENSTGPFFFPVRLFLWLCAVETDQADKCYGTHEDTALVETYEGNQSPEKLNALAPHLSLDARTL